MPPHTSRGDGRPLIAHLVSGFALGGLELGLVRLIDLLPAGRYRHAIIGLTRIDEEFARRIQRPDVERISIGKRGGLDPAAYRRLWSVLRRLRPDVLHSRNLGTLDAQWVAWAARVPVRIHGEHGRDMYDLDGSSFRYNLLRRSVRPFIHRYSAVSRDLADWLVDTVGVRRERVDQIYNGVDSRLYHPRGDGRQAPEGAPPLGLDTLVVGTVGRMVPVKNHASLIEAFHQVVAEKPEWRRRLRLAIVGDGPLRQACLEQLQAAGIADLAWLPGKRTDIPELLRSMDLFVLPSIAEGISNTILEAMACGLPVIATRVGGNPELVEAGRTGALVPAGDATALASAIAGYVENPDLLSAHSRAARQAVEARFTLEAMLRGYTDLYDRALAEAGYEVPGLSAAELIT